MVQRIGKVIEEKVEELELEPEQIETAACIVVRIALTYRIFATRVVEVFIQSVISTIKEYQWEPLPR